MDTDVLGIALVPPARILREASAGLSRSVLSLALLPAVLSTGHVCAVFSPSILISCSSAMRPSRRRAVHGVPLRAVSPQASHVLYTRREHRP